MQLSLAAAYTQVFSIVSTLLAALTSPLYTILLTTMPSRGSKAPQSLTVSEKKKELHKLYRRARHLDRKWSIGCHKPDEFTILAIIPFVGDFMSTTLALGYLRQVHSTFDLSVDAEKKMVSNIVINFVISIIPYIGWIMRRIFSVNKRNYRVVEQYIMALPSRQDAIEDAAATSKKRA
ncbi:hypothetical protein J3B02_004769 [Coemansia erecta]|uniref:Uncharacterized protein n=1 Tax=Coemansia asiatica TaxID=1052880 RepID=A0A9W7XR46_9FUNG|nr:hypothetical protein LPJ64_000932 [Coemansia asiatica]KAJ2845109.1 hypothetical protein J3B02_004769 [Coemansia erecta]KAJ2868784.1 hypothetical protein FB639_004822 [Coemansia asiatica]